MSITAQTFEIHAAATACELNQVRTLLREYATALAIGICVDNFAAELAALPGKYSPPQGRLLLASKGGQAAGCAALRPLSDAICEMKRLYVRPEFRGLGFGRQLAEKTLTEAIRIGYSCIRLDTLPSMAAAVGLYDSLGFRSRVNPACNHCSDVILLERHL